MTMIGKPANEKQAIAAIFEDCRKAALGPVLFNVHDGEEWSFDSPTDKLELVADEVSNLGDARLVAYTPGGERLGALYLVFGNAPDGEELISDYGINDFTDKVFELFSARYA